ncbi:MAG: UDP-N-acetylmuramate--L-alanine ligase [Microscillaceae bacterium]|nr:UDP-N-acetylmuramate--L-alanine ligase [Microscillaceae bacterium]
MLQDYKNIYFVGIGGIGMSALARWFLRHQFQVAGYDRTPSPLTHSLQAEGMDIHYEENLTLIPPDFQVHNTLIIFTPAVPESHAELCYFREHNFAVKKRAEVLGMLTQDHFTIAVAGTHGKTTTSSMIAHILYNSPKSCTAFLGGIMQNYDSNLLLNQHSKEETYIVAEADEYDRSFLHLSPSMAVITSTDADHLDIYGDKSHVHAAFVEFAKKIRQNGRIFLKKDLALKHDIGNEPITIAEYALNAEAEYQAIHIEIKDGAFHFDALCQGELIENLVLYVPGYHNVENALAAIAVSHSLGINAGHIRESLKTYQGVKRRFEYILRENGRIFIDDYAHHPEEIKAFLNSVRALYPDKQLTVIFQPHLFSRTRDFADEFAQSLSMADQLMLLPIYPARELPLKGVTSKLILDKVSIQKKGIFTKETLLESLKNEIPELVLTIGAGDISEMILTIKNILQTPSASV